ncbi:hypothetical protein D1631_17695 [Chryseobacterium nematophagum]|uniref:L-type lectin-like domain-containing protein n=1 Tax=Chryseobacterium nematophagum TaxID=2305228 RepID=A0A3M7TKE9_9FLAO|nr:T9SS type B sorting domain-containing protein [Chryseobacterium nematophagum]RNA63614.1 hypothetical protein D1631_17695 [Chryseobacterium nematophagum]
MKNKLCLFLGMLLFCISSKFSSQTYQLTGNPINTTGWTIIPNATASGDFIKLTANLFNQTGGIKLNEPINLKFCEKWKVEFDFKIDGSNSFRGDGLSFWYLSNPPTSFVDGAGLGLPPNSHGLMVGFDIFNNMANQIPFSTTAMSKVHVLYGSNNQFTGNLDSDYNIEFNNTPGSTYHTPDLNSTIPFVGSGYRHVEVNGQIDPVNNANWIITIKIDNTTVVNQSFQPSGSAVGMTQGYFGFSGATGGATAEHSIKNVKVYVDKIPTLQNIASTALCIDPITGNANVDLTSFNSQFVNNPNNYNFSYFIQGSNTPITNPTSFQLSTDTTVSVIVSDPSSSLCDNGDPKIYLTITPGSPPVITSSSPTICFGGSVILTSNQSTGNLWSTGETTQSITITTPGTYTLINSNGACVSNPASIIITEEADPNVQITGNLTLCQATSTLLTASANGVGNTFVWSNGVTTPNNTVTSPGIYTVTVTTPSGCQYQKSVTVTAEPLITINIAPPLPITCTNPQMTLDATNSVYQSGATFLWTSAPGGNIVSGANTLTPLVNAGGVYTLTITNPGLLTCAKQNSVVVAENLNPPVISLSSSALTICEGDSVILTASGGVTYNWTGLSGTGNTQTVTPTSTTTYMVTGMGTNGCISTPASITINVVPKIISPLHNIEICQGDSAVLDAGSGANYTYMWNTGANTQTINVNLPGTYTVTINNGGCSNTFTAIVSYILAPEILDVVYKDNSLTINAKNYGTTSLEYSIDGGVTWQASNIFYNISKNTQYSIYVRNKGLSCYSTIDYYTFFMTNIITPNDDGINDIIDFTAISRYKNFSGSIFDRYGAAVFKATPQSPTWNGKYLGRPLPTATYWYHLSWEDSVNKKSIHTSGWILLKNRD